ncbi:MAG: hypothetical protein EOO30_03985 [Comamonadaceae bacterium]|nr:MAG: hypothetical protein EOO30_03985 [Comamonadaceae bacterium]
MQMVFCRVRSTIALGLLALVAGCAGHIRPQTPEVPTRPARSATVRFEIPPTFPLQVSRSSFGSYSAPRIGSSDVEYARKEVDDMLREVRAQMVPAVEHALRNNGIPPGDDTLIHVAVESAGHNGMGPGAVMLLSVRYKDDALRPWQARISAATSAVDNPRTTAAKFSKAVVATLAAHGIVAPAAGR